MKAPMKSLRTIIKFITQEIHRIRALLSKTNFKRLALSRAAIIKLATMTALITPVLWGHGVDSRIYRTHVEPALERGCYPWLIADDVRAEIGVLDEYREKQRQEEEWKKANGLAHPKPTAEQSRRMQAQLGYTDAFLKKREEDQRRLVEEYRHRIPVTREIEVDTRGVPTTEVCRPAQITYNLEHRWVSERIDGLWSDPKGELLWLAARNLYALLGLLFSIAVFSTGFILSRNINSNAIRILLTTGEVTALSDRERFWIAMLASGFAGWILWALIGPFSGLITAVVCLVVVRRTFTRTPQLEISEKERLRDSLKF